MTHTCHIRNYQDGDEEQILRLRRRVFGELDAVRLSRAAWEWQFCRNPAGEGFIALAEDNGRIVGQYAAIPTRFLVSGTETFFAMSCDTMVHPAYGRQGLFTDLARVLYRRISDTHGIRTVWGFPNKASLPGFTRYLGWKMLKAYPLWVSPLKPLAMIQGFFQLNQPRFRSLRGFGAHERAERKARHIGIPRVKGLSLEPLDYFDREFDRLWERYRDLALVIQVRNAAFLNWRYFGIGGFDYRAFAIRRNSRLVGYVILRMMTLMGHVFGVITDLFPFPVQDLRTTRAVFRFARRHFRSRGAAFITCLISRAAPSFLRRTGFIQVPCRFNPRPWYFGVRYGSGDATILGVEENWHMTYGDTDIV